MTIKQIIFAAMIFVSTNNFTHYNSKDFAFDKRMHTTINGNNVFAYLYSNRDQDHPSYVFKHTRVVECTKDKKLIELGTLGAFEKSYRFRYVYDAERISTDLFYRFTKFGSMNNAIYCADLEQKMNYYDELENVGAIVYGTRDVNDCALFREYLKQQELAAKK